MNPKAEAAIYAAIYAAFCEQFSKRYKQPNDALRKRIWEATKQQGLESLDKSIVWRAMEIMAEKIE